MKSKFWINLFLCFFLLMITFSYSFSQEEDKVGDRDIKGAKQALLFGKQEFRNGNYDKAYELFSKAIQMDPEMVDAYYERARAANGAKKLENDIKRYEREIKMMKKGEDYHTRFGLGCSYLVKSENFEGVKEQAREELSQVLILDKDGPFAEKAKELAKDYELDLEKPPFNIMDYWWVLVVVAVIFLILIIAVIAMFMKSAPKFTGLVMITGPQGQILFNSKLEALPKRDKTCVKIGSNMNNDIILSEGNISALHAKLVPVKHNKKDRVRILSEGQSRITREAEGKSEQVYEDILWDQDIFKLDNYTLTYSNPVTGPRPLGDMTGGGMAMPSLPGMPGSMPGMGMSPPSSGFGLVPPPPKKVDLPGAPPPPAGDGLTPPSSGGSDDGFSF